MRSGWRACRGLLLHAAAFSGLVSLATMMVFKAFIGDGHPTLMVLSFLASGGLAVLVARPLTRGPIADHELRRQLLLARIRAIPVEKHLLDGFSVSPNRVADRLTRLIRLIALSTAWLVFNLAWLLVMGWSLLVPISLLCVSISLNLFSVGHDLRLLSVYEEEVAEIEEMG